MGQDYGGDDPLKKYDTEWVNEVLGSSTMRTIKNMLFVTQRQQRHSGSFLFDHLQDHASGCEETSENNTAKEDNSGEFTPAQQAAHQVIDSAIANVSKSTSPSLSDTTTMSPHQKAERRLGILVHQASSIQALCPPQVPIPRAPGAPQQAVGNADQIPVVPGPCVSADDLLAVPKRFIDASI